MATISQRIRFLVRVLQRAAFAEPGLNLVREVQGVRSLMSYGAKFGVGLVVVLAIGTLFLGLARFGRESEPEASTDAAGQYYYPSSEKEPNSTNSGDVPLDSRGVLLRLKEIDRESAALSRRIFTAKKELEKTDARALAIQSEIAEKRKALKSIAGDQPEINEKRQELDGLLAEARSLAEKMGSGSAEIEQTEGEERIASLFERIRVLTVALRKMERDALKDDAEARLLMDGIVEKQAELEAVLEDLPAVRALRQRRNELAEEARALKGEQNPAAGYEKKPVSVDTST